MLFVAVILFIVIPILIYLPSPMGIIPRNEAGNVLGYYGAVLGGAMTLGGVAWTIYDQKKQWADERRVSIQPLLYAFPSTTCDVENFLSAEPDISISINISYADAEKYTETKLSLRMSPQYLNIENIGRGELYNIFIARIENLEIRNFDSEKPIQEELTVSVSTDFNEDENFIYIDGVMTIPIVLFIIPKQHTMLEPADIFISFDVVFSFMDAMKNKYEQSITIDSKIKGIGQDDFKDCLIEFVHFKTHRPILTK